MGKLKALVLAATAACLSTSANAAYWYGPVHVKEVVVQDGYTVFTTGTISDCGSPGKFFFDSGATLGEAAYRAALLAYSAGRPIRILVDEGCRFSGLTATGIWLEE
ncbi:MAG: hypothetical protein AAGA68_02375 [Pseudomonadota bacterium]